MRCTVEQHQRFARLIAALPSRRKLTKNDLIVPKFRLYRKSDLEIYYAPFKYVNAKARIALIGITPGWTQMEIGYRITRDGLKEDLGDKAIDRRIKAAASFAGSMRGNLVSMLDALGLPDLLGIESCSTIFDEDRVLLHSTSALRCPVFVGGENYSGHQPKLLETPVLVQCLNDVLAKELRSAKHALLVPLGKSVSQALQHLADRGSIEADRVLFGFPHPSAANGHRQRQFAEMRRKLRRRAENWFACSS